MLATRSSAKPRSSYWEAAVSMRAWRSFARLTSTPKPRSRDWVAVRPMRSWRWLLVPRSALLRVRLSLAWTCTPVPVGSICVTVALRRCCVVVTFWTPPVVRGWTSLECEREALAATVGSKAARSTSSAGVPISGL